MNPLEIMKMVGNNPKTFVMNQLKNSGNPMMKSLIETAQKGDTKSVENFARNMCKERGINFDDEFGKFMKQFK